ncbi:MAG: FAD-binding protein, partial [Myxococcales bacterium]|nr:FAD-binding protein [Myxococcales bacterium]
MSDHTDTDLAARRERAIEALCGEELADIVDLVLWVEPVDDEPVAHAASRLGRVRLRPGGRHEVLSGVDPMPSEDPMAFLPYAAELADPSPRSSRDNAYPRAAERILSFFAHPDRSPDLAIVHTPRHYFPGEGGHVGEHGSLDVIQSRAPMILSGKGIRRAGLVDDHARLVDVGPTLATLAGTASEAMCDADGAPLDGRPLAAYLTGELPTAVVGILWDGAHCSDLLHLAEQGELPAVARLIERGVALRGGAVAQFPSVTLTNHTSILTGVGPGRHGVMGNVYFDRATGERVVPNDESTWHRSAEWLSDGVRTVFELVDGPTASVDEAIDRGADYSTMGIIRASGSGRGAAELGDRLPDPHASPFVGDPALLEDGTVLDLTGMDRFLAFDEATGTLTCEAGASLAQIVETFAPRGFFPAITPGTKLVTVGGCIANDVHGKAHHVDGCFSSCVDAFDLLLASGEVVTCSRTEHTDLFWATVGGLGLTGIIVRATLRLRPIQTTFFRQEAIVVRDLSELLAAFEENDARYPYSVAWIDPLELGASLGRGVLTVGDHASVDDLPARLRRDPLRLHRGPLVTVPFQMPNASLNPVTLRALNVVLSQVQAHGAAIAHYEKFFYPLDAIGEWNRGYGARGFTQYQFVIPLEDGERRMRAILERIAKSGELPFLNVLKKLGRQGPGHLSFPFEGYTF